MSKPKLSIITINLNNKEGLRNTIKSVTTQTFKDFEFIIIDGASKDGSVEVIKEFESYISFWVSEPDSGIYNAMNKGVKVAKGDYLLFLNSGDWLYNDNALRNVVEMIDPKAAICSADLCLDLGETLKHYTHPDTVNFSFFKRAHLAHQSTFIKKAMFEKYGFYNELNKISSDWEFFFLVLIIKGEKFQKIASTLSVFNLDGISQVKSMKTLTEEERQKAIDRYVSKPIQIELLELEVLREELQQLRMIRRKMEERRYLLLRKIERTRLARGLLTIILLVMSKITSLFYVKDEFKE